MPVSSCSSITTKHSNPFGMMMPGREYSATSSYRYGFNGKENELYGEGNAYDFGERIYDPRLGRFLSVDPRTSSFADWSPYVFANDNPIALIDENGEFGDDPRSKFYKTMGAAAIQAVKAIDVSANKYKALYMLAQYRNENGFNLQTPGNNPFNIKGKGDAGQISYMTTEYIKGQPKKLVQNFASFSSLEKGIEGYLNLLGSNFPNARAALGDNSKTIEDFASGLMNGKLGAYATDPNYVSKLRSMLKGIVKDFEKDLTSQIEANNALIKSNNSVILKGNAIIKSTTATNEEKRKAMNDNAKANASNIELSASNKSLSNDLSELQNFKKNEKLDK